jgi:cation diffusion facilitator CzcD-associated flavoprotein CzcO
LVSIMMFASTLPQFPKTDTLKGNGCSATQAVPVMSQGPKSVKKVTQFARQAHWLAERPNPEYSSLFKWAMGWIPLAMRLYRANLYWAQERDFSGFHVTNGSVLRKTWSEDAAGYIRKMAPAKYRDFLVPKSEIGCKRRVNDTDYLACLHQENVELIYEDHLEEIVETGVRTKSGRVIEADAIIVAQGFETQKPLMPMEIVGKDGLNVYEHVSHCVHHRWFSIIKCFANDS